MSNYDLQIALQRIDECFYLKNRSLNLSNLGLRSIPQKVLELTHLQDLILADNRLRTLPKTLYKLPNLKWLSLADNKIEKFPRSLSQMDKLMGLSLSGNDITEIPISLSGMVNLRWLNLSSNPMGSFPFEILNIKSLEGLNISFTGIAELPKDIAELARLTNLQIAGNKLQTLPETIGALAHLTTLNLLENLIHSFPEQICDLSNLITLAITRNSIPKIPDSIRRLYNLRHLFAKGIPIKTLPNELFQLVKLECLHLDATEIVQIPDELASLESLTELSFSNLQLVQLPPAIGKLSKLRRLFLRNTALKSLPKEIGNLRNLQRLTLSGSPVSELPETIGHLRRLTHLDISRTPILGLPKQVRGLQNLEELNFENSEVQVLPKELLTLRKLRSIEWENTKIKLPPEIVSRYKSDPHAVLTYYFENVLGVDRPLKEVKMLLLGEGEVGKTALVNRLIFDKFIRTNKTEGIDIHSWEVLGKRNQKIQVNIWDFAGQEITHATHQFFLTKRSLYLLVLASRGDESSNRLEEWLKVIQNFGGESPVIIVCNKSDEHTLSLDERALFNKYHNLKKIIRVSCKKGTSIKNLRRLIVGEINRMPHVFDNFSQRWFRVKEKLEDLSESYVPYEDYLRICREEGVMKTSDQDILIKFLHDLGVVLNFRDDRRLSDTNVLKPEWITRGVYKILTSKLLGRKNGILDLDMLSKILDSEVYPTHKHQFIIQMMQKFERCFSLSSEDRTFLVPDLLPKQEPELDGGNPQTTGVGFQFHYEIQPGSFMTRFIVNMREYIHDNVYWRKGVVLKNADGNRALVKADLADKVIFIWIEGKFETRRGFLSVIRKQFEAIHSAISNLVVKEYVEHRQGLILYDSLLKLEARGIERHYFPDIDTEVDVSELLNGFERREDRRVRMKEPKGGRDPEEEGILYDIDELEIAKSTVSPSALMTPEKYSVALSFAGEDRDFVKEVYEHLEMHQITVFYDYDEQTTIELWGKELIEELDDIYRKRSLYVVMFISEHYARKVWTRLERRSALARAINEKSEYILPARFDDTELPGLLPTVAFVDLRKETPETFANKIVKKLNNST